MTTECKERGCSRDTTNQCPTCGGILCLTCEKYGGVCHECWKNRKLDEIYEKGFSKIDNLKRLVEENEHSNTH